MKQLRIKKHRIGFVLVVSLLLSLYGYSTWERRPTPTPRQLSPVRVTLSPADIRYGEAQVDAMMRDRPAMTEHVQKGDVIYRWVARQFAGEAAGQRVSWLGKYPSDYPLEYIAHHQPPYRGTKGHITIRQAYAAGPHKGQRIPHDTLWAAAVYELFNIGHAQMHLAIYEEAVAGKLTRAQFIEDEAYTEHLATRKSLHFYRTTWVPWATRKGMRLTNPHEWYVYTPKSYAEWRRTASDPNGYPESFYGQYYDDYITPYREAIDGYERWTPQ